MSFQSEIPDEKRRSRINVKPNKSLLDSLKRGDQSAIQAALSMRNASALAAVEEAIAARSGNSNVEFYRVGGQVVINPTDRQDAFMKLTLMSGGNQLLQDPAYTQSLIAKMGEEQNQVFIHLMQGDSQTIYNYQLLGIQMQLGVIVGEKTQSTKFKPLKYVLFTIGSLVLIAFLINLITYLSSDEHKSDLSRKAEIVVNRVNWDAWENVQYIEGFMFPRQPPNEGNIYMLVDMTITNTSSKPIEFYQLPDDKAIYLEDSEGFIYFQDSYISVGHYPYIKGLAAGSSGSKVYSFEVPEDVDIVDFVAYGIHSDLGEKSIVPTSSPVPYGATLEAVNGMSMILKEAISGQDEDGGNYVLISMVSQNLGKEEVHFEREYSLYLQDDDGNRDSIGGVCPGMDFNKELYDLGFDIVKPGQYFTGQMCFTNLEKDGSHYKLIYYPADGFLPNYIFLLPAE